MMAFQTLHSLPVQTGTMLHHFFCWYIRQCPTVLPGPQKGNEPSESVGSKLEISSRSTVQTLQMSVKTEM